MHASNPFLMLKVCCMETLKICVRVWMLLVLHANTSTATKRGSWVESVTNFCNQCTCAWQLAVYSLFWRKTKRKSGEEAQFRTKIDLEVILRKTIFGIFPTEKVDSERRISFWRKTEQVRETKWELQLTKNMDCFLDGNVINLSKWVFLRTKLPYFTIFCNPRRSVQVNWQWKTNYKCSQQTDSP